jgi:hypothetical protein
MFWATVFCRVLTSVALDGSSGAVGASGAFQTLSAAKRRGTEAGGATVGAGDAGVSGDAPEFVAVREATAPEFVAILKSTTASLRTATAPSARNLPPRPATLRPTWIVT